jgi:hypothetical protein
VRRIVAVGVVARAAELFEHPLEQGVHLVAFDFPPILFPNFVPFELFVFIASLPWYRRRLSLQAVNRNLSKRARYQLCELLPEH